MWVQERAPIAADFWHERTFALIADVSEAHGQIPFAACDGYLNRITCTVGRHRLHTQCWYDWVGHRGRALSQRSGRFTECSSDQASRTWHLLVAANFTWRPEDPSTVPL